MQKRRYIVTPLAGVWIEISSDEFKQVSLNVTPLAGVWIEIYNFCYKYFEINVTPLAGVWIEILLQKWGNKLFKSLPLRECGLK